MISAKVQQGTHIIIDIETLGTRPGSVITSIGAIKFNLINDDYVFFERNITIDSSLKANLKIDPGTLKFWMEQPNRMELFTERAIDLEFALDDLVKFINPDDKTYIWGNSARFDLGLLDYLYERTPWITWNEMDLRTLNTLFPEHREEAKKTLQRTKHNALNDCVFQVKYLRSILSQLNKVK